MACRPGSPPKMALNWPEMPNCPSHSPKIRVRWPEHVFLPDASPERWPPNGLTYSLRHSLTTGVRRPKIAHRPGHQPKTARLKLPNCLRHPQQIGLCGPKKVFRPRFKVHEAWGWPQLRARRVPTPSQRRAPLSLGTAPPIVGGHDHPGPATLPFESLPTTLTRPPRESGGGGHPPPPCGATAPQCTHGRNVRLEHCQPPLPGDVPPRSTAQTQRCARHIKATAARDRAARRSADLHANALACPDAP